MDVKQTNKRPDITTRSFSTKTDLEGRKVSRIEKRRNIKLVTMKLGRHVPKPMVYGEFGKSELKYTIWQRMIGFWKGLTEPENKLSNLILSKKLFDQQDKWNSKIKSILISLGVPYVFEHVELISRNQLKDFTLKKPLKKLSGNCGAAASTLIRLLTYIAHTNISYS